MKCRGRVWKWAKRWGQANCRCPKMRGALPSPTEDLRVRDPAGDSWDPWAFPGALPNGLPFTWLNSRACGSKPNISSPQVKVLWKGHTPPSQGSPSLPTVLIHSWEPVFPWSYSFLLSIPQTSSTTQPVLLGTTKGQRNKPTFKDLLIPSKVPDKIKVLPYTWKSG